MLEKAGRALAAEESALCMFNCSWDGIGFRGNNKVSKERQNKLDCGGVKVGGRRNLCSVRAAVVTRKEKKIEMERTVWKVLAQCLSERNNSLWERAWSGSGQQYYCFPGRIVSPEWGAQHTGRALRLGDKGKWAAVAAVC